jgi:hypothetical protein
MKQRIFSKNAMIEYRCSAKDRPRQIGLDGLVKLQKGARSHGNDRSPDRIRRGPCGVAYVEHQCFRAAGCRGLRRSETA